MLIPIPSSLNLNYTYLFAKVNKQPFILTNIHIKIVAGCRSSLIKSKFNYLSAKQVTTYYHTTLLVGQSQNTEAEAIYNASQTNSNLSELCGPETIIGIIWPRGSAPRPPQSYAFVRLNEAIYGATLHGHSIIKVGTYLGRQVGSSDSRYL